MVWLKRALSRNTRPLMAAAPRPGRPFFAVGDVHGRDDLLAQLLELIARHPEGAAAPVVFAGDYVDRGPSSAAVLRRLAALRSAEPERFFCLRGNHEGMMLDFLADPEGTGAYWLRNGGTATLESFGIPNMQPRDPADALARAAGRLGEALGDDLLAFVTGLPFWWREGDVAVVHGGADPALPITAQDPEVLAWGHPDFHRKPREDGLWIVHGHTIVPSPTVEAGRIAVDTGAYRTGRLTAAFVAPGEVTFLST